MRTRTSARRTQRRLGTVGCAGLILVAAVVLLGAAVSSGQTQGVQASRPWPPNRLPDGQPDVQGGWGPVNAGTQSLTNPMSGSALFEGLTRGQVAKNPSRIVDPPDGQIPYQPWAAALKNQQGRDWENPRRPEHIDPQARCMVQGVPRPFYLIAYRILQPAGYVVFVWDAYKMFRIVPLDGRPHVGPKLKLWMGDSRGRWEGNTLVIDVTNLNANFRLSIEGDFFTNKAHITERLTFNSATTATYEARIDDPTTFTRPWTLRVAQRRGSDEEPWESACHEGERNATKLLATEGGKN